MSNEVKKDKPSLAKYLASVKSEVKKVTWPSKKELVNYTGVVLAMCLIASVILGFYDLIFKTGFNFLVK